ncbi:MAG: SsrA-binding protein SmpB [Xanthomonadaceae bacterium]|nr:SsrA-binding protein SmpB [Rhodospirillaceae bacterium]NIA17905.1 SsrA-binding protein SmpB [Xanthomonadaceae bacterium]
MPILSKNKKVLFDYEILEKFEAGIVLTGAEVKSAKQGQINLKGSYITFLNNEPFLANARISPYKAATKTQKDYDPQQKRKILLRKKEILRLKGKLETKGLTITPISVYTKNNLIKIEICLVKGKKKYEKREAIKKRDLDRKIREKMKSFR